MNYVANLGHYIPELLTSLLMVGLILIDSTYDKNAKCKALLFRSAIVGLFIVLCSLYGSIAATPVKIFTNSIQVDPFGTVIKIIMVLGTMLSVYLCEVSKDIHTKVKSEFLILSTGVLVGGMLLTSANNLLILYIGIETLSILSYALASLKKDNEKSSEAGLKYSLYGGVSAGIMLFGMSHIYGVTGTIYYTELAVKMGSLSTAELAIMVPSLILFLAGIGYKISSVPFHMWAPDVYEGSPIPVTAFFSIVPKVAGIAALVRVTYAFFGGESSAAQVSWIGILQVVAALTMTVGNIAAINQRSVKRMLAYSSIGHAGVMMLGAVVIDEVGPSAILFYGVTYLFMTMTAFFIISFVNDEHNNDNFERFNGLIYKHPLMAIVLTLVMFSLAGIPPLSGFVAKFNILSAIVKKELYVLSIITVLNSVVSIYYYLKVVQHMIFVKADSTKAVPGFSFVNSTIICVMFLPVLLLGVFWSNLLGMVTSAAIFVK